jgi:Fe-S-cluster-containing dehydrogenase component
MARNKEKEGLTRREFLAGAGTVLALGAVAGVAATCTPEQKTVATQPNEVGQTANALSTEKTVAGAPVSSVIQHDATRCAGCGVCGLMCSFYHESESGTSMARNGLVRDPFEASFTFNVCQQCTSPNCYYACPQKDKALCVDLGTGVKYINTAKCIGCGSCTKACKFTPARSVVQPVKKVAFKCDLCRDRMQGPICVEFCTVSALRFVPGAARS